MSDDDRPCIGVILGSGLGSAADWLLAAGGRSLEYTAIAMPLPHVIGHTGRLVLGRIDGISVAMLQGRVHCYEGHSIASVEFGTRLLQAMGARTLIVTNAAGGIRADLQPGNLMLITSHLRPFAVCHATRHFNGSPMEMPAQFGLADGRCCGFRKMHDLLWNEELRQQIREISSPLQIREGVYAMMTGPNYETPAEIRALQRLGADAVGMSTVPEALAAASLGMRVLGVSCITNVAAGLSTKSLNHAEVTATAAAIERPFTNWLWDVIRAIGRIDLQLVSGSPAGSPMQPTVHD
ncbi:MAG: purine-nucleoside phosphorylase [Planctomycetaceae bacterium]